MPSTVDCPICGTKAEVDDRTWYHTCRGCGSGVNLIGIWWNDTTGENWMDMSSEEKIVVTDKFFSREKESIDWSNVIIEI